MSGSTARLSPIGGVAKFLVLVDSTLMAKMDKNPAKVFAVFLNAMVKHANVGLIEKAEDAFFQLAASFSRNDFQQFNAFIHCLLHNPV